MMVGKVRVNKGWRSRVMMGDEVGRMREVRKNKGKGGREN